MEPLGLKIKKALSRLNQTDNYLFRKPEREWDYDDLSLVKSFLRSARVEEDYTMEDLNKIQEFFSKPLEETTFKVGQKVTYLGHPAVVTATKEHNGRNYVSVSYDKGKGKTKASDILTTDGSIKPLEEMMSLDDQAKAYYLEKFKKGEISSLPEDPKAAFLNQMMKDEMEKDAAQYRRETGLEEVSAEYSRRNKRPIKVGDIVGNTVQGFDFKVLDIQDDLMKVKNFITGKEFMTDIDNMQLLYPDESVNEAFGEKYYIMVRLKDAPEAQKAFSDFIGKNDITINKTGDKFSTDDVKAGIKLYRHLTDRLIKVLVHNLPLEDKYLPVYEGGKWGYQEAAKNMIKFLQNQLDDMGVEYEMDPKSLSKPFIAIYKPENQSEELNAKFEDFIEKSNLKSVVKEKGLEEAITDPRIGNPKFGPAPKQFADLRAKLGDESLLDKIQMINVNTLRDLLDELDSYNLEENKDSTYNEYSEVGYKRVGEAKGGELDERYFLEVSVRDARKALDIFRDQYRDAGIEMYGSNVYASNNLDGIYDFYYDLMAQDIEILDSSDFDEDDFEEEDYEKTDYMKRRSGDYSEDEFEQSDYMRRRMDEVTKGFGDRISAETFSKLKGKKIGYFGNTYKVIDSDKFIITLEDEDGDIKTVNLNQFIQKGIIPELKKKIQETIKLGEGMIEEELCPKGKAYLKKRKAAGEKSSAYLSGRAVKVCKGQMKG